jgi:hypothetical protein
MWFKLAAAQGDELAATMREFTAWRLTPAEIAKAERLAREWVEKHRGEK